MAMVTPVFVVPEFAGRCDNGSQTSATWKYADGTCGDTAANAKNRNFTQTVNENFRVRFTVQETAGGSENNKPFKFQAKLNTGSYQDITTSSTIVKAVTTTGYADGDDTTQQIGDGTFITDNNGCCEDGVLAGVADFISNEAEFELCCQIVSGDVSDGDTVYIQIVATGGEAITGTPAIPSITVDKPSAPSSISGAGSVAFSGSSTIVGIGSIAGSCAGTDLTADLAAHWDLDETSGTRYDSNGVVDLVDSNGVSYQTGKISNAADFEDTSSQHLHYSTANGIYGWSTDQAFTYCGWFKKESGTDFDTIIGYGYNNADFNARVYLSASKLRFTAISSTATTNIDSVSTLSDGVWYFFCARHDPVADVIKLRLNTTDSTPVAHSTGLKSSTLYWPTVGAQHLSSGTPGSAQSFWDGLIDEVGVWNRVLTDSEVDYLYNGGSGRPYSEFLLPFGFTGTGTLTPLWPMVAAGSVTFTGTGSLEDVGGGPSDISGAGSVTFTGSASMFGIGSLTAAGSVSFTGTGDLDGIGHLTAAGSVSFAGTGSLVGIGGLTAAGSVSFSGSGILDGIGSLTADSAVVFTGSGSLDGLGSLTASGTVTFTGTGDIDDANAGVAEIIGSGSVTFTGSGSLDGIGGLTGTSSLAFSGSGALDGIGGLEAAGDITFSGSGSLDGLGYLTAVGSVTFSGDGTIINANSGLIIGSGDVAFTGAGVLDGLGVIIGSSNPTFTGTGTLTNVALKRRRIRVSL